MGQWNAIDGAPGTGRAVAAVRAVTALSRLRVVLSLDQLAAYTDVPMHTLDEGLSAGPVADGRIERVVQGSYVGYRHPDAAWTTLPSRLAAASAGVEFARWFADWLDGVGPERRKAAHATARAVSAAARAAGKTALADRIESVYSRRKRREAEEAKPPPLLPLAPPPPAAKAVSRLSTRTTAGILIGTAVLLTGAVAGVAALSETTAIAGGVQAKSIGAASPSGVGTDGIQASFSSHAGLAAASSSSATSSAGPTTTRPSSSATSSATPGTSSGTGPNGTSPVQVDYVSSAGGSASSGASSTSGTSGSTGSTTSSTDGGGSSTSPTTAPATTASATTTSAAPTTSIATTSSSDPVATATTPSSGDSTAGCLNLLGLISVCL